MFWQNDQLSPTALSSLLVALNVTFSRQVEPEHFLLAMWDDEQSSLVKAGLRIKPDLNRAALREAMLTAVTPAAGQTVPAAWSDGLPSPRARAMMQEMQADPAWSEADASFREELLAAAALKASKRSVRNVFSHSGVAADALEGSLRTKVVAARPAVFDESGIINPVAFDPSGRRVLQLIESEGKGLGLARISAPLCLYALVSRDRSLLDRGLRLQNYDPRLLRGNLLLHLRGLGKKGFNESLTLRRELMQAGVISVMERAAELAYEMRLPQIGEAELLKALVEKDQTFVGPFLTNCQVNVLELSRFVRERSSAEEEAEPEPDVKGLATIEEVEQRLRSRIVGQSHVIDAVMPMLKRLRFGYVRRGRPIGVLLFLGMSGTGKTQLAKEIARAIYGAEDQMIFLEMGSFGSEHSKTMFIGAPQGLVGYNEGQLTNGLRDKPEAVVLFDEVEKAHRSVFDVVLRFLDEGQITEPSGTVRDGLRSIIILTSNKAMQSLKGLIERQAGRRISPQERDEIRQQVRAALLEDEFFRPEFINRVDDVVLFNSFTREDFGTILRNQLAEEVQRLADEKDKTVRYDDALIELLIEKCMARGDEGARVCGKLISDLVIAPLIDFFVSDGKAGCPAVRVGVTRSGGIEVQAVEAG